MSTVTQAFSYEVPEFSFKGVSLNRNYIKYILIQSMYEAETMATLFLALHVPAEIYQDIVESEKTDDGFFNIVIRAKNVYSETAVGEDYISGRFAYILPTSNPDYSVNLSNDIDKSYKSIVCSLSHKEHLDIMKSSLCGTYVNIDIQDLLRLALKDFRDVVVQPPTVLNLQKIKSIVIPPMNSMRKLIDYIFNVKPFYNTGYTFFADFNKVYLTAHDKDTSSSTGAINHIVFHIASVTSNTAYLEGITFPDNTDYMEGDMYHVYINPADISVSPNKGMDMISNQLMGVNEEGVVAEPIGLDFGVLNSASSESSKLAIRRGSNLELYANIMNSNTIAVEFKKSHINGSIITPDKVITVNFELTDGKENYNELYSGEYYITYKKEIIRNNNGTFAVSCNVGLKRIADLISMSDSSSSGSGGGGSLGYRGAEGNTGSRSHSMGTTAAQTQRSASNASSTQSNVSRVSRDASKGIVNTVSASKDRRETLRKSYNLKKNYYGGPEYIDTKSSGATVTLKPHITEKAIR